jgi:murein L,D-transpeptidase YcbB/YkuD
VPWLDKQLALIQNTPHLNRDDKLYDEELAERVKKFQAASGFFPDGVVGPQTIMRLNSAEGNNAPLLIKKAPGKKD